MLQSSYRMTFLVLMVICVGYSLGASIHPWHESDNANNNNVKRDSESHFEVISLDAYDVHQPLVIRSRIPDELRSTSSILTNKGFNILPILNSSDDQIDEASSLILLEPPQPNSHLSLPLAFRHVPFSKESYYNAHTSNAEYIIPTISPESLAQFAALLNSNNAGAKSIETQPSSISQYPSTKPEQVDHSHVVVPVPLQNTAVDGDTNKTNQPKSAYYVDLTNRNHPGQAKGENGNAKAKQPLTKQNSFVIEKVPEVASFIKTGPFEPSDIPSLSEIQAVFNNATETDNTHSPQVQERSGLSDDSSLAVFNDVSNELDDDIKSPRIVSNILEDSEEIAPQPLSYYSYTENLNYGNLADETVSNSSTTTDNDMVIPTTIAPEVDLATNEIVANSTDGNDTVVSTTFASAITTLDDVNTDVTTEIDIESTTTL